jgi:endo-1,4-beta-D-glucanase Y
LTTSKHLSLVVVCLMLVACAAAPPAASGSGGSGGGSTGTGGGVASGTGGAPSTGGSGTGAGGACPELGNRVVGSGGPFAFPQDKKPPMCNLTTYSNASAAVLSAYNGWKTNFVTTTGAGSGLRVRRPGNGDDTVSEGIGYGMLAAVYMGDRATFDGLWAYAKAHFDAKGLMNWKITPGGSPAADGVGSATDGDEDMAWALIMASNQWTSPAYLEDAKHVIGAILTSSVAPDGMLTPGDGWGSTPTTYPDYFSPAYFRAFAAVTCDSRWTGVIMDRNYAILMNVSGTNGLVPDATTGTYQNMGNYSYDACRTPWRIGMDYCFNNEPRALAYLQKIGAFFNGVGAANIGDGYALSGSQVSGNKNMAFIGPAGVAGMVSHQQLLDGAFAFGATNNGGDGSYYPQSLKIITMLMMSGNFLDYTLP